MTPFVVAELLPHLAMMSLQASVLAGFVLILRWTLGVSLSPRWRYALWLLVLCRLAWPFSISSSVSLFNLFTAPFSLLTADPGVERWVLGTAEWTFRAFQSDWLFGIWALGVVVLAGRFLVGWCLLLWRLRDSQPVSSWPVWWLLQECKVASGIDSSITIVESPHTSSPCVLGLSAPKLVLPWGATTRLSREELRDVFLHELAHIKRSDLPAIWIVEAMRILHWFNPIVWYICRRMEQDREEACDEMALDKSEPDRPRAYGSTLLKVLEGMGRRTLPRIPGVVRLLGGEDALVRRLKFILHFQQGTRTWVVGGCCCLAVCILGFTDPAVNGFGERLQLHLQEQLPPAAPLALAGFSLDLTKSRPAV